MPRKMPKLVATKEKKPKKKPTRQEGHLAVEEVMHVRAGVHGPRSTSKSPREARKEMTKKRATLEAREDRVTH